MLVVLADMIGAGLSSKVAQFFPRSSAAADVKEPPVGERPSVPGSADNVESALDEKHPSKDGTVLSTSVDNDQDFEDPSLAPGELSYDEGVYSYSFCQLHVVTDLPWFTATSGGMGRHLGVFSCTMLM